MAAPKSLAAATRRGPLSKIAYGIKQRGTKGALRAQLGVKGKIPTARLRAIAARLSAKAKGPKKLTPAELKLFRRVQAALRFRGA